MVIPPDETEWSLAPEAFAELLRERWPAARLEWVENAERHAALDFDVDLGNRELTGRFLRDGQGLSLDDAEMEQLAEVALWFRDVVPAEQPLLFLDEAMNGHVSLERGMTVDGLATAYLAEAWGDRVPGFMVSPPEASEWALAPSAFAALMSERWPEATITVEVEHEDPFYDVVGFALDVRGGELTGWFGGVGQVLHIDAAAMERLAELALWFRDQVPPEQPLVLEGEGYDGGRIGLERGMTVEQVAAAYLGAGRDS